MPEITSDDGVRLHYVIRGTGPVWVFCLHWMGGNVATWNPFGDALDLQEFRLVALDSRGHGRSHRTACPFTIERLACDVLHLADELQVERFAVAGHSFGGKTALRLAALAPRRVTGLALIGAVGPGCVPLERPVIEGILQRATEPGFVREVFQPWFRTWPRPAIDAALVSFAQTPEWALRAVCEAALWTDITPATTGVAIPALVIAGAHDPVYGPAYQEQAVRPFVPSARMVTLADCGHGLILEQPEAIAAHVGQFLRLQVEPGTASPQPDRPLAPAEVHGQGPDVPGGRSGGNT